MEPCRHVIRPRHECVDNQGRPVHGDQVCFWEARSQMCDQRAAESARQQPLVPSGKDLAVGS